MRFKSIFMLFFLARNLRNIGWMGIGESVVISVGYVLAMKQGTSVRVFMAKFGFTVDAFLAALAGISLFFGTDFTDYTVFFISVL